MAQEITLPVKLQLENLQQITKDMRSQLSTLQVNSSGYKKLEGIINNIEKRIQDIQVIASRPIMDGKQFVSIEKDISHIYDDITKLGIEAGHIKFSDLKLDGTQQQRLQEFDDKLKIIKNDLKNIEESAKTSFLSTDVGKAWGEANPKDAVKSFSSITKAIELEVARQKQIIEDAKTAYNSYQNTIQVSKNINSFMRGKDSLAERIKAAGIFDQIFREKDNNFKNGGRNVLEAWLKSEFSLSDEAIKSITQGSGAQVLKAFEGMKENVRSVLKSEQSRLSAERKTAIDTTNGGKTLTDKIAAEEAKQQTNAAVQNEAVKAKEAAAQAEAELRKEEQATQAARGQYINGLTNETRAHLQMGSSCDQAKSQLNSLNEIIAEGKQKLASLDQTTSRLQGISNFVNRYVGAYAIIRKVSTAIRNAFNNIKELDKTITDIAVVTNMSQEDLWNKVGQYTQMAQEYGVTTNDVYKVSQLFYQQGLQTSQVMSLTVETLKMAKIAGMGYTEATNAMTVAVRAFNIEMSQAQQVTDTYSALAAKFAVSSQEIANAMEKTASSAANVGMSLQSTSAFMSVMIQTTRESAQNIGSALKSIISRYGEMKASPDKLINVDGEEVAFNKVDTALASIGISIKDAAGQFRDFDDVIMELAAKWNTLDNNTQRYIATIMAGNRQQSRFIALVSNYGELSRAMDVANNAENASIVQVAKTMDSLESKTNQLKNAFSQLYLDLHIESGLKNIYDWLTRIITTVGKLGTLSGAIPMLMNIFGFGTGLKGTIKAVSDNIQAKKLKIETDNSEFERKKEEIEAYLANPHDLNVKVNVDDSQLQSTKNEIMFMNNSALASAATTTAGQFALLGNIAGTDSATRLNTIMSALTSGKLSTEESRKKFLTEDMKMDEESPIFNDFMLSLEKLANSAKQAGINLESLGDKSNNSSKSVDNLGKTSDTAGQQTQGAGQKAEEAGDKFRSAGDKADSSNKNWQTNVMKGALIFSAAARLLGTAITAAGAGHQDKSTDNLETSKLLTGIGNGLSMAGTGAQLGTMTHTWWGPIVGGVVGFIAGGMTAIFDGLHMSLDERLALEKQEAKKASDEALKAQAKTTDISSQIDNIKKLQKAMYNSTEDMQAYKDAMNTMAAEYPTLISGYDAAGNAIIEISNAEAELAAVRQEGSRLARTAAVAEAKTRKTQIEILEDFGQTMSDMVSGKKEVRQKTENMGVNHTSSAFILQTERGTNGIQYAITGDEHVNITGGRGYGVSTNAASDFMKAFNALKESKIANNDDEIGEILRYYRDNPENTLSIDDFQTIGQYILDNTKEANKRGHLPSQMVITGSEMAPIAFSSKENLQKFISQVPSEYTSPEKQYDYGTTELIKELDTFLEKNGEALGISQKSAREYFGWGEQVSLTEIQDGQRRLNALTENYNKQVKILNQQVTRAYAQEELDIAVGTKENNVSLSRGNTLSTSGIFTTLITNGLENAAKIAHFDDAAAWSESEEGKDAFIEKKRELSQSIIDWTQNLTDNELDAFIQAADSMDSYLSVDEILNDKHFKLSLADDSVKNEIIQQFKDSNKVNRDRILNLIWNENQTFNSDALGAIEQLDNKYDIINISDSFTADENGASAIISKYANYFTDQLLEINNLAQQGYTQLASNRLTTLKGLSDALSNLDNSKEQQNLFATITSIDFTNYDSLVNTQKTIEQYKAKNNITAEESAVLDTIIQELENAQESLVFNVNTLVQSITESIANAAKETDNIISINKSGIDLSNALSQLDTLNIGKSVEEASKFDELFKFDATLGKYVYTYKGLDEALKASQGNLEKTIAQLKAMEGVIGKNVVHTVNSDQEAQQLASVEFAGENAVNDILSYIDGYATWTEKQQSYYEVLAKDFMADGTREHTWTQWLKFVQERHDKEQKDIDAVSQIIAQQKKDLNNQLFTSIDWTAIARGTDYSGANKTLVEKLAQGLDVTNATWENVLEAQLSGMYGAEESIQKMLARQNIYDSIYQADISAYQDAIADILKNGATSTLKASTVDAITRLNGSTVGLAQSADQTISAAKALLDTLAEKIGQGGYTLDSYNADAKSILERTLFNQGGKQRQLLEFASGDITADSLESLANALNLQLTDLVDVTTGKIKSDLQQHLEYDTNTGTYKIATSFEDFINAIQTQFNIVIDKQSKEYIKALSDYNDAFITKRTENKKTISDELSKLKSIKAGDWLNLSYTVKELKKYSKKYTDKYLKNQNKLPSDAVKSIIEQSPYARLEENLVQAGAYIENGILKLTDDANLLAVAEALTTASTQAGLELTDELKDMVQSITKAYTDAIISGIKGGMTNTDATNLRTVAKNLGVNDISFTETAEGLKLSTESALQLYTALSQTNALQKKLVFKELKASLEENNEHYKDANALLTHTLQLEREIAEIRSDGNEDEQAIIDSMTQELILAREILATRLIGKDTSWDFMSQDQLPDSIDNAISYWSSWADGIKDVASWAKTGNVDINKFSSMLKHVMDIAQATGKTFQFMGAQIGGKDGKTWDEFISGFYKALDFDEQGNAIFNLEKLKELGYDVSMGIEGISKELQDAVGTYAQENAERLASFEKFYDGLADAYEKVKNSRQKFIDDNGDFDASDFAKYLRQNEKSMSSFYTFAETIKVNGQNLASLLRDSSTDWAKASQNYKALKGIYEMMTADDWDASQGYQAIIDHLSTSGFSGELTMGDMRFNVKSGKVVIETLDDKGNVSSVIGPDGTEYPDAATAWQAIKEKELNDYIKEFAPQQENPKELTYTIAGLTYTIKVEGDHFVIVRDGKTIEGDFENIPEAFNKIAEDSTAVDLDQIKGIADREGAKKVQAGLQQMSDKGKQTYIQKGGEKRNDFSNATFGLNYNGIYSEAALANAQGKTAEQLQQQFTDIWNNTNLTTAQKVAEVQVQMGIDVDPKKVKAACDEAGKVIEPLKVPIDWKAMAQQAELTSGATDVLSGITAAFSGESGITLGKQFGQGIAEGIQEALNKNPVEPVTENPTSPTDTGNNNGEGETIIISTYDDSTSNKNELLKNWTVAIEAYDDEGATKPEVEPVTQNIEIDENATGAALDENTQVASAGLIQDIRLSNNDTEAALKDNDSLANNDVNQDVEYTVNAVKTAILQNVADAKDNPAIQELRVTGGGSSGGHGFATGNVGPAKAGGTLIGELGPELVVSNGHYFVAGQDGAEFINLSSDAIVFNHLQTRSLLEKGMSNGRGRAITNERKAAAFAQGGGRALEDGSIVDASNHTHGASSNWSNNMLSAIINNTNASKNGASKQAEKAIKAFIKEVDRWYNYLQEIARLERDITKEEKLRSEYQSHMTAMGKEYADSLLDSLPLLRQQAAENRLLANDQEKWLKGYVAEQADSPWAKFWTIDEHGQEKYNLAGFEKLEQMVGTDKYGKPNMTPEEQMAYLKSLGVTDEWFQYDSSGNAIDTSTPEGIVTAIQSLWEHMDKTRETVQTHLDSIAEHNNAAIDNQTTINGHLKSIEDNQIAVENKVLKAIEETRQREIDAIQDEKDAIEKSSQALITGLSDQLSKEQDMYSRQQDANELSRLQRQLSILQRSGGSASQIASLQKDITERQQDAYFDAQKAQIAALQDASDNQLQKLQEQIDLMTEQLAYEKEHGMLWEQVYQVMAQSPEYIADFIMKNTEEHWGKSPTEFAQVNRETLFQAEWFKEISDRVGGVDNLVAENDYGAVDSELDKKVAETEEANAAAKEAVQATANAVTNATNTSGNSNSSDITGYYYQSAGAEGHYLVAIHADGSKTGNNKQLQPHTFKGNKCTKCYYERKGAVGGTVHDAKMHNTHFNTFATRLASGGLITKPTYSLVGETGKPEAVLNPEQTSILRNEILGNKPNSALSMLSDLRELWNAAERTANIPHTNDASVIIENATVEMNVSRIANDYDAQRAGEQALDQMLAIARRTQAQNRVGR